MGPCQTYRLLSAQNGGQANIGCTKRDLQNYGHDIAEIIKDADAQTIIDAMKKRTMHYLVRFGRTNGYSRPF